MQAFLPVHAGAATLPYHPPGPLTPASMQGSPWDTFSTNHSPGPPARSTWPAGPAAGFGGLPGALLRARPCRFPSGLGATAPPPDRPSLRAGRPLRPWSGECPAIPVQIDRTFCGIGERSSRTCRAHTQGGHPVTNRDTMNPASRAAATFTG